MTGQRVLTWIFKVPNCQIFESTIDKYDFFVPLYCVDMPNKLTSFRKIVVGATFLIRRQIGPFFLVSASA